jgi:hypothetical protein
MIDLPGWMRRLLGFEPETWGPERMPLPEPGLQPNRPGAKLPMPHEPVPSAVTTGFLYQYPADPQLDRFMPVNWFGAIPAQRALSAGDIEALCDEYRIPQCHLRAVLRVEAAGSGFLLHEPPPARPKILFEAHIFYRESGSQPVSKHDPDLSARTWREGRRHYQGGSDEWHRLDRAMIWHEEGALRSASWGLGQVMGFNHRAAGCASIQQFVIENFDGEAAQLRHVLNFCEANHLLGHLRAGRWAAFARGYNGPGYRQHRYDDRLAAAARRCH